MLLLQYSSTQLFFIITGQHIDLSLAKDRAFVDSRGHQMDRAAMLGDASL